MNSHVGRQYHVGRLYHDDWHAEEEIQNHSPEIKKEVKKKSSINEPSWVTKILQYEYIAPDISDNWWRHQKNLKNADHKDDRKDPPLTEKQKVWGNSDEKKSFVRNALKKILKIPETKAKPKKLEKKENIAKVDDELNHGSKSLILPSPWANRSAISEMGQRYKIDSKIKNHPMRYSVHNHWQSIRGYRSYQSENAKYSRTRRNTAKCLEGSRKHPSSPPFCPPVFSGITRTGPASCPGFSAPSSVLSATSTRAASLRSRLLPGTSNKKKSWLNFI